MKRRGTGGAAAAAKKARRSYDFQATLQQKLQSYTQDMPEDEDEDEDELDVSWWRPQVRWCGVAGRRPAQHGITHARGLVGAA